MVERGRSGLVHVVAEQLRDFARSITEQRGAPGRRAPMACASSSSSKGCLRRQASTPAPRAGTDCGVYMVKAYQGRRVLVTGGTGLIGSRLAERLALEEKAAVCALVHHLEQSRVGQPRRCAAGAGRYPRPGGDGGGSLRVRRCLSLRCRQRADGLSAAPPTWRHAHRRWKQPRRAGPRAVVHLSSRGARPALPRVRMRPPLSCVGHSLHRHQDRI